MTQSLFLCLLTFCHKINSKKPPKKDICLIEVKLFRLRVLNITHLFNMRKSNSSMIGFS